MRKHFLTSALVLGTTATAWAGGFLTNSNQNAAFLRNPARDGYIAIDGCYYDAWQSGKETPVYYFEKEN